MKNGQKIKTLFLHLSVHFLSFSKKDKILKMPSIHLQSWAKEWNSNQDHMKFGNNWVWEWWSIDFEQLPINLQKPTLYNWANAKDFQENLIFHVWTLNNSDSQNKVFKNKLSWSTWENKALIKWTALTQFKLCTNTYKKFIWEKSDMSTCTWIASRKEILWRPRLRNTLKYWWYLNLPKRKDMKLLEDCAKINAS